MSVPSLAQRVAQVRSDPAVTNGSGAGPLLTLLDALVVQLGQVQDEHAQYLPVARLARLLRELYGVLSTGTVETLCLALAIPVAHMDETGLRLAEGTTWRHVIRDANLTLYRLGGRGEVWTDYAGVAVHDRFAAYGTR